MDFTQYDVKPKEFINYLRYYGPHFNKKLCEFACKLLKKQEYTKDKLDTLLESYSTIIKNSQLYDYVYIANWLNCTFYGSGISDEKHLILALKDIFDKESSLIFNRWYADMAKQGIAIEWDEMV